MKAILKGGHADGRQISVSSCIEVYRTRALGSYRKVFTADESIKHNLESMSDEAEGLPDRHAPEVTIVDYANTHRPNDDGLIIFEVKP